MLKIYIYLTVIIMFLSSTQSFSLAPSKIEFTEYNLDNGLHVILYKDNSNPLVSIDIWYHVGSKNEDTNRTGFAHLFEHMMFQGSQNVGKAEHFSYIQKAGGTLNGTTNQDRTNYFETVPSNQLELVLWLESDRMGTLNVTQENFDNQREVVKEEKRQRYDNVPYGSRFYNLFNLSYSEHPYKWIPIGSMDDLNNADLNYAKNFYKNFYAPNNAVLVIAGDIDYENTKKLVQEYFGDLKPAAPKLNGYPEIKFGNGGISDTIYDNINLPAIYIGYKVPGLLSKDNFALNILSDILSEGRSSRLYKNIVYENQLAKSINSFVWDLELAGLFVISSTGMKNSNLKSIEEQINKQIELISSDGITEDELQKAKNKIENRSINRLQTMMGIADQLAYYWTYFRNTNRINTELNSYLEVTPEDISRVCKDYLKKNNGVVLYYLPAGK
jgi:predicted Zn-dependent peptidase